MAKVTRMQQRRGLHRDLPVPLKPGEIGLTTDTRELFIGNDTSDAAGGAQNKTVQIGNVNGGGRRAETLLGSHIVEFIVKRSRVTGTGTGPFTVQKIHSGLSALAEHVSGVKLETGINDQTLIIHKYSPANYSHTKLLPGDPDGTPIVQGEYNITGTNQLNLVQAITANDIVYVVYLNRKDLENYLITEFNTDFDLSGTDLTDLDLKLSTDQLYYDETTGEGFIGLNDIQVNTNHAGQGGNKPIKDWLKSYISTPPDGSGAGSMLNEAFNTLGATFHSASTLDGAFGVARFGTVAATGADGTTESTVPIYTVDGDLGFTTRSHKGAINMSKFLNQSWLREGSAPTKELTHIRSNIKVLTETNAGDIWANIAIGNPGSKILGTTSVSGTNDARGAQTMRPLGSTATTTQTLLGVLRYEVTSTRNLELDYSIEWYDGTPTYHVVRTGNANISMPVLATATNIYGHGLILDQWNEMDIMNVTGALSFAVGAEFDLGVIVAKHVTIYGDPIVENDLSLSSGDFQTKYGTSGKVLDTDYFLADSESTSPTYGKYFGFITYSNTRPVDAHIRFINKRF